MARLQRSDCFFILLVILISVVPVGASDGIPDNPAMVAVTPAPAPAYAIRLFVPEANSIHSVQVHDLITLRDGDVLVATSRGISTYNGTWDTRSVTLGNLSEGLLDNFVTAIEYDHDGNLWIGYPGGIQIYNGVYYQTYRDQQLFKDLRILDLQRWHDDMWIATGNAGIHRYRNDTWTWYQPFSSRGPGFYKADSMALDSAGDSLYIATEDEGLWQVTSTGDQVSFKKIQDNDGRHGILKHVRHDPLGGVLFFGSADVVRYRPGSGFEDILTSLDLYSSQPVINDIAGGPDGKLYLATDNGIYIWENGAVSRHLGRADGIGTSPIVSTIDIDAHNRVWFSTHDDAGYFLSDSATQASIPIMTVTSEVPTPVPIMITVVPVTPEPTPDDSGFSPYLRQINQIFDSIASFISQMNPFH